MSEWEPRNRNSGARTDILARRICAILSAILKLVHDNPGQSQSELRRLAVGEKSLKEGLKAPKRPIIGSHRTFDKYIKELRKAKLISVVRKGKSFLCYESDLSLLEWAQDNSKTWRLEQLASLKELDKDIREMNTYYDKYKAYWDAEMKALVLAEPARDCLSSISQIVFLSTLLQDREHRQFDSLEKSFRALLRTVTAVIMADPDAQLLYTMILVRLAKDAKPAFEISQK